jgi:sugar fermentation stimulation protein A
MEIKLQPATFLKRYKRFMADVKLPNGEIITVHCPNSGSMKTLLTPNVPCAIHDSQNPKRKLRYTLTLLGLSKNHWALVDTQRPNAMVEEAINNGTISELSGYETLRREVKYGKENSRIDILLESPNREPCYVEVKNNTMLSEHHKERSDFPDAVTTRGAKHLRELMEMKEAGYRAVLIFTVNRSDVISCGIASYIDPTYGQLLQDAMDKGVEVLAYRSQLGMTEIKLDRSLPVVIDA